MIPPAHLDDTSKILRYMSKLAPGSSAYATIDDWQSVKRPRDLVWLGWQPDAVAFVENPPDDEWYERSRLGRFLESASASLELDPERLGAVRPLTPPSGTKGPEIERLAVIDGLHREEVLGRAGWFWLAGSVTLDGSATPVCLPIFVRPVHLAELGDQIVPIWRGSLQLHPRLAELGGSRASALADSIVHDQRAFPTALEMRPTIRLRPSATSAMVALLASCGIEASVALNTNPLEKADDGAAWIVPGAGFYIARDTRSSSAQANLTRWSNIDLTETALEALYFPDHDLAPTDHLGLTEDVWAAMPINRRQREITARVLAEPVVAVSGPPGTGKTHAAVSAAADAISRGNTVLIATKSDHAAESVCELLDRYPTPNHVRFGHDAHRRAVAERLSAGTIAVPSHTEVGALSTTVNQTRDRHASAQRAIQDALVRETAFGAGLDSRAQLATLTSDAPGVLDDDLDIHRLERLLDKATGSGPLSWLFARRAEQQLRAATRARKGVSLDRLAVAVAAGRSEYDMQHAVAHESTDIGPLWDELHASEDAVRDALAALVNVRLRRGEGRSRASAAALGSVLRAGRSSREDLLNEVEDASFLDQLPLWVGTLDEIEQTLPAIPKLFDLVIFDESSQIDQFAAAPALCRSRRAMIVGDPKQLRHVSFTSDDDRRAALDDADILDPTLATVLDVRRNSLFDVAAAAAPVTWLDEHFRCGPHLIGFSNDRFYDNSLRLMTQHPINEGRDVIDTVRLAGKRLEGVNQAEIDYVIKMIRQTALRQPGTTIGVVTPFRAQADALEEAIVNRLELVLIRDSQLRVGTVHGLQGTERDVVIISLCIDDDSLSRSLRFIEDPNLFNVMTTRAKHHLVAVHSFDPANLPRGLLADWFRWEESPPKPHLANRVSDHRWTNELAEALRAEDLRVVINYPVAGWEIDLAIGTGVKAIGVETRVHPEGPDAHIARHLTLRRAGWNLNEAFQSRWLLKPEAAAAQLATRYHQQP